MHHPIGTIEGITRSLVALNVACRTANNEVIRNQLNQLIQNLKDARSLGSLEHAYRWAFLELDRILGHRLGPNPRAEELELRAVYRAIYPQLFRARNREAKRRSRAANPEKTKAQNRKAARNHYRKVQLMRADDEACARAETAYHKSLEATLTPEAKLVLARARKRNSRNRYMQKWRAANPVKAKAQSRDAMRRSRGRRKSKQQALVTQLATVLPTLASL